MDLVTHIPGIANSALFTPGANTPAPYNVAHTGLTDGVSTATASKNMAEIYNRWLLAQAAVIKQAGLTIDNANWTQMATAITTLAAAGGAGGVTKIIAGTNVTISPTNGLGNVTINSAGGAGGGASVLDDLTDVVITGTPTNGQILNYDTGTSKWVNVNNPGSSLTDLMGVVVLVNVTSGALPATGTWLNSLDGGNTGGNYLCTRYVTAGAVTSNTWYIQGSWSYLHARGSDGVWYATTEVVAQAARTMTLPAGVIPVQLGGLYNSAPPGGY